MADEVFTKLATNLGYDTYVSANAAVHNPEVLKKFDLVIWNNVSGNVLTELQRQSLKSWIAKGGGWLGVHGSGGDLTYAWDWYADTLIGSRFSGHSMSPQFQDAKLYKTESGTEISGHLPEPWLVKSEEWYAFDSNPRDKGYEILITIDEDSYITHGRQFFVWNDSMEGEHPLVWRHTIGEGRVFYSAIGHRPETYRLDTYQELLKEAMQWAADD